MKDGQIVELFWERNEQAVYEAQRAYGGYCFSVSQKILDNPEDSEEVVADTWLRAWNSIPPERPVHLKQYFAKITRNLALSLWRTRNAEKRGGGRVELALEELGECIPSGTTPEGWLAGEELQTAITVFLRQEPQRERNVFLRRYFYMEETGEIARRYGLREGNVFQILSRTRKKLKKYLMKEGWVL